MKSEQNSPPNFTPLTGNASSKPDDDLVSHIPEKVQRSLFGEILDWMLAPLLLLWPMSIAITYLVAKSIANQPFDRALEDNVLVLTQQVKEVDGKLISQLSLQAKDILRADDLDTVFFQIKPVDGGLIDGESDIPAPNEDDKPANGTVQLRNDSIHGVDVRVAYSYIDFNKNKIGPPKIILVQVAETLEKRALLANEIIKGVILPQFIILPVALTLVWFALARGLSPLTDLQIRIRARKPDDLSPIDSGQVPEEISPLVMSLNDMLARLAQTIEIQKRFIADAAHQMKTPLAGMRMQSELALRQTERAEIQRSLLQLAKSSDAATHLVNQLLSLARAENLAPGSSLLDELNLVELTRTTVQEWIPASLSAQIDLGFEQSDNTINILGNALMLHEMLNNLIDNALRYTPKSSSVTVRVNTSGEYAILEVEDNGPGIPAAERAHVFERFYRILGSGAAGSGLGLAIVKEIAQQHNAHLEIGQHEHPANPKYPGCIFRIRFALYSDTLSAYLS